MKDRVGWGSALWPLSLRAPRVWVPLILPPASLPPPHPRHYNFSWLVPRPYLPGVQPVLRARSAPCNPSRLPWPQHNARISDSSFKVCFRLPPPHPLLPPTPSIILPKSGPQYPPSPQSYLRETFSCSCLSFALPLLAPGLLSSISGRFSQDPTLRRLRLFSLFARIPLTTPTPSLLRPLKSAIFSLPIGVSPSPSSATHVPELDFRFALHPYCRFYPSCFHPFPPSRASSQLSSSQNPGEIPGNKARKIRVIWEVNRNREGRR